MIKFTVLLVVVAACISSSAAFQCYVCDSTKGDNCIYVNNFTSNQYCPETDSDEISKRTSGDCMQMKFLVNDQGIKHVKRACQTYSTMEDLCAGDEVPGLEFEECSFCDYDLCNASGEGRIQDLLNSTDESPVTSTGFSTVEIANIWMTLIPAIFTVAIIKFSF